MALGTKHYRYSIIETFREILKEKFKNAQAEKWELTETEKSVTNTGAVIEFKLSNWKQKFSLSWDGVCFGTEITALIAGTRTPYKCVISKEEQGDYPNRSYIFTITITHRAIE